MKENCNVQSNSEFNKESSSLKRHLLKTISWRLVGTIDTIILGWVITGNPLTGLKIGVLEILTKMTLYFIHERIWYKFVKLK
jgi:uncharacterized membrane protein